MNLSEIKDPSFLNDLTNKELEELSKKIRTFLIESLSKTGGHLSSNLGVVELTIALHKVFESPKDKFIFDVGHQGYTHKILTGRAKDFDSLRKYNGLSGFLKRSESIHDIYEAGHSSTSIAAASGMEISKKFIGNGNKIIPIIGDGALTGGLAFEALNFLGGQTDQQPIIILND
ncbi:MAG: 1-deoxy-D-xylulose-5-phosphate synthase, partial [Candidatus Izimaplasma sp.]|nr:1-deoxy-D-xylulose-5-phosphate synthase [Candidatus Izimaplasma bacterium]